jgi:hypothetical protein
MEQKAETGHRTQMLLPQQAMEMAVELVRLIQHPALAAHHTEVVLALPVWC